MTWLWNLPFAAALALALWCRVRPDAGVVGVLAVGLRFFGVGGPEERAVRDFLGIAGLSGLMFVGWSDRLAIASDAWLAADVLVTSIGLGLAGAWALARASGSAAEAEPLADAPPDGELTMMSVDEPPRRGESGPPGELV
jgi:hypothetical protein